VSASGGTAARYYPYPTEGNTRYFTEEDEHWWRFKAACGIEEPEPGRGIEERFAAQTYDLSPPAGFITEGRSTLSSGGDIMAVARYGKGAADHLWDEAGPWFFDGADLVCANLEGPCDPEGETDFSVFPPVMNIDQFWWRQVYRGGHGVTCFSTANNHPYDRGVEGLERTMAFLKTQDRAIVVGTAASPEERDAIPVVERGGIRYGLIAWTFGLNNHENPPGRDYLVNHTRLNTLNPDLTLLARDVTIARLRGADVVVAALHWSLEFESWPLKRLVDTARRVVEAGVDIVLGNHPHGVQPVEVIETASGRKGLVYYAHGDLVSTVGPNNERLTIIARTTVERGTLDGKRAAFVTGFEARPFYSYRRFDGGNGLNTPGAGMTMTLEDLRLLDLWAFAAAIERGGPLPVALNQTEREEILRVARLARRVLGKGSSS